ncbi:MAG: arsenate reductase (glutaredoxin) [Rhodovibrionaceae bacterium]
MAVTIYHNPRCSKSRQTLALIEDKGVEPLVIEYLKTPPSKEKLTSILKQLGLKPRELLRKGEPLYKDLKLDDPGLSDKDLIAAMVENPILIERPIVLSGDKACLGRPPEKVIDIL